MDKHDMLIIAMMFIVVICVSLSIGATIMKFV